MKKISALILCLMVCIWMPMSFASEDASSLEETLENNQNQVSEQEAKEQAIEETSDQEVQNQTDEVGEETQELEKDTIDNQVEEFKEKGETNNSAEEFEEQENQTQEKKIERVVYHLVFVIDGMEQELEIKENDILEKPQDPYKEGYEFLFWMDQATKEAFDFSKKIVSDHTLIATFDEIPVKRILLEQGVRVEGLFLEDEELLVTVKRTEEGGWIYSLKIVDDNGQKVALRDDTFVSITLEDGVQAENMQLKYENEIYPATMRENTLSFTTNHFSDWSISPKVRKIESEIIYPVKKYYGARKLKANAYPNFSGNDEWWWMSQINKFRVDDEVAFCVQPGMDVSNRNSEVIPAEEYIQNNLGGQANFNLEKTNRIIYHGWETSNQSNLDYLVTQLMVWQDGIGNVTEYKNFTFDDLSLSEYQRRRKEILEKVNQHTLLPSFNNEKVDLSGSQSVTLTDDHNVLDQFEEFSASGIQFQRNGSTLTIISTSKDWEKQSVTAEKKSNQYIGLPIISMDDRQDVMVYRLKQHLSATLNFVQEHAFATIKVIKGGPNQQRIEGVVFGLYQGDTKIQEKQTAKDGTLVFDKLQAGEYCIKEISVPEPYVRDDTRHCLEVSNGSNVNIILENEKAMGRLVLHKKDQDLKSFPVAGAKYAVLNEAGEKIDMLVTDQKGFAKSKDLPLGKYTIQEVEAPIGYELDPTVYPIEFLYQDDQTKYINLEKTFLNKVIQSELHIFKTDEDKKLPVAGAIFNVFNENNRPALDVMGKEVGDLVTNQDGFVKTPLLRYGKYILREVKAPSGYLLAEDVLFEINKESLHQNTHLDLEVKEQSILVEISKQSMGGKEIAGAKMQIYDQQGNLIEEWTSTEDPHLIKAMAPGKYVLHEFLAPAGYQYAQDLDFEVLEKGGVQSFVMIDQPTEISILKVDEKGNPLPGATLQIISENGKIVKEWISTDQVMVFNYLEAGEYILHEKKAPNGYFIAKDQSFMISNTNKSEDVVMVNQVKTEKKQSNERLPDTGSRPSYRFLMIAVLILLRSKRLFA